MLEGFQRYLGKTLRDLSTEDYERRARERELAALCHKAARLGLALVESST
jgi:hypothetical protein